jgi:nitrite reductase/ring-hydroxylating ferredoxin subunit/DMSO/TMAO reductase YedYZ heme-binding membrane subunit
MSHAYTAIGWNRQKRLYDLVLVGCVAAYLLTFIGANLVFRPQITAETLLIRAFGSCALLMLHVVLAIGPLCRLDRRFLPLLYNRRHLGVTTFLVALAHGVLALMQFHAFGSVNPLVSVLSSNGRYDSLPQFPFQPLGLIALVILFLMAATSHDFWLTNLTAPTWKALHMSVYVAYGLITLHVALGTLQAERSILLALMMLTGLASILTLHLVAAWRERSLDQETGHEASGDGFVDVCRVEQIPEGRARVVTLGGERIAVFRYDGKLSAVSNVCQHQNGPLGEGRLIDGCVTCPWHGYQYAPDTGSSPPPFSEKVPTFGVRVEGDRVLVDPRPHPPGTRIQPAACGSTTAHSAFEFYVGYLSRAPLRLATIYRRSLPYLGGAVALVALLIAVLQGPYAPSIFEYQNYRQFEGTVVEVPHPMLEVQRPGFTGDAGAESHYLLTVFGKHGADASVRGLAGHRVRLGGALLYHEGLTMLELENRPIQTLEIHDPPEGPEVVGRVTLEGEIVDSKCYLGTMKPARWKPHRACAINCIAGGVPPLLVVETSDGSRQHFLLVDPSGAPINDQILDRVAEPVSVTGERRRLGDLQILAVDPGEIVRLE